MRVTASWTTRRTSPLYLPRGRITMTLAPSRRRSGRRITLTSSVNTRSRTVCTSSSSSGADAWKSSSLGIELKMVIISL